MSIKGVLKDFVKLRDELAAKGPSEHLRIAQMDLFDRLYHYLQRRQYEKARIEYAIYREFLDSSSPMTDEDIAYLDASVEVDQEITSMLRAPTPRKRGRVATQGVKQDAA